MMHIQNLSPPLENHVDSADCFRALSQEISRYAEASGASATAYHHMSLPHFSNLEPNRQMTIVEELTRLREFYNSYEVEGWELKELKQLVWFAMSRLGAHPPGGLMIDLIEDGDVIEIFDDEQAQIFRSFTHYNFCSYTIEELVSLHWTELYTRDDSTNAVLSEAVHKAMSENVIVVNPVPSHLITESRSIGRYEMLYNLKSIVPLSVRGQSKPTYVMAIIRAELVNKSAQTEENIFQNYLRAKRRS